VRKELISNVSETVSDSVIRTDVMSHMTDYPLYSYPLLHVLHPWLRSMKDQWNVNKFYSNKVP
jgi:hypothetical protein